MTRQVAVRRSVERVAGVLAAAGLLAACSVAGGDSSTAGSIDLRPTTTISESAQPRDPFLWPFSRESPWNTPIGTGAQFSRAGDETTVALTDRRVEIWVNSDEFSHPVVRADADDPAVLVSYEGTSIPPFAPGVVEINMPVDANPATGPDSHLHVVDAGGTVAHEFFGYTTTPEGATASYYVPSSLTGDGISEGGTRAYGGSALGGLIRTWELEQGRIRHALALALTGPQLRQGPIWPASAEDANSSETYRGPIPMGTLVAIPSSVNVDAMVLSPASRVVAKALQEYGAYVVDQARAMTFYAEPGAPIEAIDAIRAELPRIRRELRVVTNSAPNAVGGGGEPIAPLASPLD